MPAQEGDEAGEGPGVGDGVLVLLLDREEAQDEAGLLLDVLAAEVVDFFLSCGLVVEGGRE